jgi:hypothetical protein
MYYLDSIALSSHCLKDFVSHYKINKVALVQYSISIGTYTKIHLIYSSSHCSLLSILIMIKFIYYSQYCNIASTHNIPCKWQLRNLIGSTALVNPDKNCQKVFYQCIILYYYELRHKMHWITSMRFHMHAPAHQVWTTAFWVPFLLEY